MHFLSHHSPFYMETRRDWIVGPDNVGNRRKKRRIFGPRGSARQISSRQTQMPLLPYFLYSYRFNKNPNPNNRAFTQQLKTSKINSIFLKQKEECTYLHFLQDIHNKQGGRLKTHSTAARSYILIFSQKTIFRFSHKCGQSTLRLV